ncbi:MAG: hypothetical protein CMP67_08940 [Flavobacteriales bacterium]|nr:hypothetical protein [Flavobacteriales bacterium]MBO72194.1 hypothetical protein [Flavobacteriales bacterium]|tara:strand:- start:54 stop:689 length:636 start_codon:yes stop_codon:yes gene_type:complete
MKTIVLSPQKSIENETDIVVRLFELGLTSFHLRKPHYTKQKMRSYLEKIPSVYHNRIIIHSHHRLAKKYNLKGIHLSSKNRKSSFKNWLNIKSLKRKKPFLRVSTSFTSISELNTYNDLYDYVFLSPIFDSTSKKNYQSGFKEYSLTSATQRSNYNVVALGGVDFENIKKAFNMGFWGCAFLNTIWSSENPSEKFKQLKSKCNEFKYNPIL